jgi:hypothetical protein
MPPAPVPPQSTFTAPAAWLPPPVTSSPALSPHTATPPITLKLKEPEKKTRVSRTPTPAPDVYIAPTPATPARDAAGGFPWKLVAAAVVLMVMGVAGGRMYWPDDTVPEGPTERLTAPAAAPVVKTTTLPATNANTGRLEIETQPAGARVLLDGKPAGESPLTIDRIPAGRHTVTFVSASGSVKRTIRIESGRTAKLDVPIFSGWVGIFAPFIVNVAEAGRVIGTTEEPRLMLSPGRHLLTLTNRELGYTSLQTVDIEPGEVRSVSLDPRGRVNLNATPWAEVWLDGKKIGDTPIANLELPLGTREVVFRHPQFGDRHVTVTVKGNGPAAVSVDMSKP